MVESAPKMTGGVFDAIEAHPGVQEHAQRRVPYLEQHYKVPRGNREAMHQKLTAHGYEQVTRGNGGHTIPPRTFYRKEGSGNVQINPTPTGDDYMSFSFRKSHD